MAGDTLIASGEIAYPGFRRCPVVPDPDLATIHLKRRLAGLLSKDLPPIPSNADEQWECEIYPVRGACEAQEARPSGRDPSQGDSEA